MWWTFEEQVFKSGQALQGARVEANDDGRRLRARIERDAYDNQSSAVLESWTATGWQEILRRPIGVMEVGGFSYVSSGWESAMRQDLADLIAAGVRFVAVSA